MKCKEIIEDYLQINTIIKKLMEFEILKNLTLTDNQIKLMRYQFKYLNFGNPNGTLKYLNSIKYAEKIKDDQYDREEISIDNDLKMLENFKNYYNY